MARRRGASPNRAGRLIVATLVSLVLVAAGAHVRGFQFQMPDPIEMSGIPLPSRELPDGTVSVRVIRGELSNNVVNQAVELIGADETHTVSTDEFGRAQFAGVPVGTVVRAVTTVDGSRLESQPFPIPDAGGIRVMLVAPGEGAAEGARASGGEARPGVVAFGGESRFVLELGEDNLEVYYLLDLMNPGSTAVMPETPIVLALPDDAVGTALLQGTSPQARVSGGRIEVTGPFAPGATHLEVAYFLPYGSGDVTVSQPLPAALSQLSVLAQKHGGTELISPQIQNRREVTSQGRTYIVADGPGLPVDSTLTLRLTGLPHHSRWPGTLAVVLAIAILGAGLWSAMGPGDPAATSHRRNLESRRDMLFETLVQIETQRRAGSLDAARYAVRRRELIAQLERVYRSLDTPNPRAA